MAPSHEGPSSPAEPLLASSSERLDDLESQPNGAAAESSAGKKAKDLIMVIKPDRTALGLGSYALSSVFLASMLSFAKILGQREMPVFEILLARSSTILVIALIICAKDGVNPFGNRRGLLAVRGIFGFGAIGCYLWAIQMLPLADAMVLTFLAPLWVSLLGPVFIKETPSKLVLVAIPACVVGVAFITQPEFLADWLGFQKKAQPRSLLGIALASGQALFSACAKMCVRELRKTETANVSVFYLSFCSTIGALCGCFGPKILGYTGSVRMPVNAVEWLLLIGVGTTGYGTQICMTFALQNAKAAPAIAMSYLSVVWSLLFGIGIFHEYPDGFMLIGALLICSCTLLLGIFERKAKPAEPPADEQENGYDALPTSEADNAAPQEQGADVTNTTPATRA
jgi:drug/metabolite transporter (DMT)-like permease